MARYIHTGNLIMYLDMALIENKYSLTAGYALLKLHQIINEHPLEWPSPEMLVLPTESKLKRLL